MHVNRNETYYLASAVHDMTNPLTVIKLRLELMKKAPERLFDHLPVLEEHVERLEELIGDLIILSRLDLGILTTELVTLNLNDIARRAFVALEPMAKRKNLTFILDIDPDLPSLLIDERHLERIIINLLVNAITFTPDNGLVMLTTCHNDDELIVTVRDSGIGIENEALPHIFKRFYRAESAKQRGAGSGLGLALVKEISEYYGGTVEVDTQRHQGSRFTVRLPIWTRANHAL